MERNELVHRVKCCHSGQRRAEEVRGQSSLPSSRLSPCPQSPSKVRVHAQAHERSRPTFSPHPPHSQHPPSHQPSTHLLPRPEVPNGSSGVSSIRRWTASGSIPVPETTVGSVLVPARFTLTHPQSYTNEVLSALGLQMLCLPQRCCLGSYR